MEEVKDFDVELTIKHTILVRGAISAEMACEAARLRMVTLGFRDMTTDAKPILDV